MPEIRTDTTHLDIGHDYAVGDPITLNIPSYELPQLREIEPQIEVTPVFVVPHAELVPVDPTPSFPRSFQPSQVTAEPDTYSTGTTSTESTQSGDEATGYQVGSTGQDVTGIEEKLANLGYYHGEADGVFGPNLQSAVMAYQADRGLDVDGVVGPATLEALNAPGQTPRLEPQVLSSQEVPPTQPIMATKEAQRTLKRLDLYHGEIDGLDGPLTQRAVRQFQSIHALAADGVIGPETTAALTDSGAALEAEAGGNGGRGSGGGNTSAASDDASEPPERRPQRSTDVIDVAIS